MRFGEAVDYFNKILDTGCVDTDEEFLDAVETAIRALDFSEIFSSQLSGFASEYRSDYVPDYEAEWGKSSNSED